MCLPTPPSWPEDPMPSFYLRIIKYIKIIFELNIRDIFIYNWLWSSEYAGNNVNMLKTWLVSGAPEATWVHSLCQVQPCCGA